MKPPKMAALLFGIVAIIGLFFLGAACESESDDQTGDSGVDDDSITTDDDSSIGDDSGVPDDSASDDDSTTDDDSESDDDTSPGNKGWMTEHSVSSGQYNLFRFHHGDVDSEPTFDLEFETEIITAYEDDQFFCVKSGGELIYIWKYDGSFSNTLVYDGHGDEWGVNPESLAYFGPAIDDYLILVKIVPDEPGTYLEYFNKDPGVFPYGLFSGFDGGAFPYDETTIYSYDGITAVPLATLPVGKIQKAVPWRTNGTLVLNDTREVWSWDPDDSWVKLVQYTPGIEVDALLTDPEGDILLAESLDESARHFEYYIIQDGSLISYSLFDAVTCSYQTTALLKGSGRIFWCKLKPSDLICDETEGTTSYLVTEIDNSVTCRGTDIKYYGWGSMLRVQW